MAQAPKTSSKATTTDSQEIIDAVDETAPSKTTAAPAPEDKKAAKKDDMDKVDDRNPVLAFIYDHPWISMFVFYIILTALVRVWGWATIVFLLIPLVCFGRIFMLSRNTTETIDQENHEKLAWWARIGLLSSVFGLASALILNWLGVLHIFNN